MSQLTLPGIGFTGAAGAAARGLGGVTVLGGGREVGGGEDLGLSPQRSTGGRYPVSVPTLLPVR